MLYNSDNSNNDIIFFKLWRNIVINRVIFRYVAVYKKNKCLVFDDRRSLRLYGGEREYITKLTYINYYNTSQDMLRKGDLPEHGVLKVVDLSFCKIESCDIFPQTVEIIHFNGKDEIQLTELPSSIKTITNVLLKGPLINNKIPSNITSIEFSETTNPSEFNNIAFPNTIKKLIIKHCLAVLPSSVSSKTFFPSSLTELTVSYNANSDLSKLPMIPSSVTKLFMDINYSGMWEFKKSFIPFGVKELTIHSMDRIKLSSDSLPLSVTKLSIYINNQKMRAKDIKAHSIPNSITDLTIQFYSYPLSYKDFFPNSLTSLVIGAVFATKPPPTLYEIPSTLKYLKIGNNEIDLTKK